MAVGSQWDKVLEALERLSLHKGLHPTLAAMRALIKEAKADPAFAEVQPRLSHVTLFLAHGDNPRRVCVGWAEGEYEVAFVDPPLEFSQERRVRADEVLRILHKYLARLDREERNK